MSLRLLLGRHRGMRPHQHLSRRLQRDRMACICIDTSRKRTRDAHGTYLCSQVPWEVHSAKATVALIEADNALPTRDGAAALKAQADKAGKDAAPGLLYALALRSFLYGEAEAGIDTALLLTRRHK